MNKKNMILALLLAFTACSSHETIHNKKQSISEPIVEKKIIEKKIVEKEIVEKKIGKKEIGSMLMVGFMGLEAPKGSQICEDIANYNLGGVILFDVNPIHRKKYKNIKNKKQLAKLTRQLQSCSNDGKLLIAVDQEGGRVQRLKSKYGFKGDFPKASTVIKMSPNDIKRVYQEMGEELRKVGINYNLAPVVDLAINKKNRVIYKLGRSFGSDPKKVAQYSTIFIDAMHNNGVLTSLKHFPGHGSSLGDTHRGFVDVTNKWQRKELEPYRLLTEQGVIDTVMVAHVFNKRLDSKYPATLSSKTIKGILRQDLGFEGVVITDDLQMGAINNKYGLKKTLELAIGAGNDILLFGNQLSAKSMVSTKKLVDTVRSLIRSGKVDAEDIRKSNARLELLKQKI